MKKEIIIFACISIIILCLNVIFNLPIYVFILGAAAILLLLMATLSKHVSLFLLLSLSYLYLLLAIISNYVNIISLITILILVFYYVVCFNYTFNLMNNKTNIQFSKLKFPDDKEYLVVNYLTGPYNKNNTYGLLTKEKGIFKLSIEDKNKCVFEYDIVFDDIKSIDIDEKPYMKPTTANNYETDITRSYFAGRVVGTVSKEKSFKMIKSYEVKVTLKNDDIITLVTFSDPVSFFKS